MPIQELSVRGATHADAPLIADVLAEAFFDDPLLCWLFPDDRRRPALLRRYFLTVSRGLYLPHRESFLVGDLGTLLCLPPGVAADAMPASTWMSMLWRMLLAHGFAGLNRARAANEAMKANHPAGPHYYLHSLGVRTERQGQGIGSALLSHVTRHCDNEGFLAYLENSKERNTPLYERHGFRIVGEWRAPGGPLMWWMLRQPDSGGR